MADMDDLYSQLSWVVSSLDDVKSAVEKANAHEHLDAIISLLESIESGIGSVVASVDGLKPKLEDIESRLFSVEGTLGDVADNTR